MWREFFGPNARIIGIDLNPSAKKWEKHGFEIFIGNQSDKIFWTNFIQQVHSIDVVLDDGGHTYLQQIVTAEMLLPHINDDGMLVIEDTHTSYMDGFGPQRYSFIKYVNKMIDDINHRFSQLGLKNLKMRVWSIQCFESIVAFHINFKNTNILSEPTTNNAIDDLSKDYRNHEDRYYNLIQKIKQMLRIFKLVPGFWLFCSFVKKFFENRTNAVLKLRQYFK